MKTTLLGLLFLCLSTAKLFAQSQYTVKGSVIDSSTAAKLVNTSICVLNAKDTTLVKFTRATSTGAFGISNLPKGKFILLVTYPAYADYVERFELDSVKKEVNFGKIILTLKEKLLKEVLIKGQIAAIKIKGDTTIYDARAYKIQPNSKVEDLLKQLPGIQVDKDGKITAQGETVNKVLVDGEEFFGDDPTLVTKNIRGDMVDKVQLYDKKSDQATFTGIDDGIKTKTINIKLKEDKKVGYFGKIDGGAGTDNFYQEQGMYNYFKAKMKVSAYGTLANTGKTGLGYEDNTKYGSSNIEMTDGGGIMIIGGNNDDIDSFNGKYNGEGIPKAITGGAHYDSKWNKDKESINSNYKLGSLEVAGTKNTQTQNNYADGSATGASINSNSDNLSNNSIFRQKLDAVYTLTLDSLSNLKVSIDGTLKNNTTRNSYISTSLDKNNMLLNTNNRSTNNAGDTRLLNASVFYSKKFKKVGRTFSWNLSENYNNNTGHGYLNSEADFYTGGAIQSKQVIDQYKTNSSYGLAVASNITFTEAFTKQLSITGNYGITVNNSQSNRKTFNKSAPNQYDVLNDTLSNDFKLNQLSNQVGAVLNYKKDKAVLNFGAKVTGVNFNQIDAFSGNTYKRDFINWAPQASYQYRFSQYKSLRLSYNGNTRQPSIGQVQPLKNNNDPLNITLGNPDLVPSFSNRFNLNYNSYKVLSGQSIYISGSYSFTVNPIVSNVVTDLAKGTNTQQSVNLTSKNPANFSVYSYLTRKLSKWDVNIGTDISFYNNEYYNYINNSLNKTTSNTYSIQLNASKYKTKKYDIYISGGPNYNTSQASLQTANNNNAWGASGNAGFTIYLPAKFQIGADNNYQFKAKTKTFNQDFNQLLVNFNVGKRFLKDETLKINLAANDLLNQNAGFDRYENGNVITQNRYTTIKRYFMFSITWDFNKMGGAAAPKK